MVALRNRFDIECDNHPHHQGAAMRLMGILLRRYWSEVTREPCTVWSPVHEWGGTSGHYSLVHNREDQAHAVLARDEWGIVWC